MAAESRDAGDGTPGAPPAGSVSPAPPSDRPSGEVRIEALGLTKVFGPFAAIRDVTFSVRRGEVVAFLGPNGAGKSTTMRILTGFLAPTSGSARIAGHDVATDRLAAAARLGYLPENGPLYPDMTPRDFLRFLAGVRDLPPESRESRVEASLELCSLGSVADKPVHKLSKGFRQRVGMAQALLHDPEVLILDEPTVGLDPNQIRGVRRMIRDLGSTRAVLLSTHILQEVEAVADRVVFLSEGRVVHDGSLADLAAGEGMDAAFRRLSGGRAA